MKKVFLLSVLLLIPPFFLTAEEPAQAVLLRGPLPHNGIEYLGVNVIPANYGEYEYGGSRISIYLTFEDVYLSEEWTESECGIAGAFSLEKPEQGRVTAYVDSRGWTAFIAFDDSFERGCEFLNRYRIRQNYFLNLARDTAAFSFPAFIELD